MRSARMARFVSCPGLDANCERGTLSQNRSLVAGKIQKKLTKLDGHGRWFSTGDPGTGHALRDDCLERARLRSFPQLSPGQSKSLVPLQSKQCGMNAPAGAVLLLRLLRLGTPPPS